MTKDNLDIIFKDPFAKPIEDFEQLMEQSNKVFLIGAGCSKCAGLPLTIELTEEVLKNLKDKSNSKNILSSIKANYPTANTTHTIEDYMSEIVDLIAISQRYFEKGVVDKKIKIGANEYSITELKESLSEIKENIFNCIVKKKIDISEHRKFVKAIHKTLRYGKGKSQSRTDYIILNYDTLIEDALAIESINYVDGFYGGATGWWDVNTYDKFNFETKIMKPHGSIDWCLLEEDNLPRRLRENHQMQGVKQKEKILIWPASTKYRETQLDPYAQIFEQIRKSLRPKANEQTLLCTIGYRFSDSHINLEIENSLKESEGNLTMVAFLGEEKPNETLMQWISDVNIREQIRLHFKNGYYHGDNKIESKDQLPWWKLENVIRLLEGEKV